MEPDGTGTGWNRNWMEREFDPYIGAQKLNFRTVWSFSGKNPAMSIFSMRGIRWFQRELLKRLIYISFGRFNFWGVWGRFGPFLVSEKYPPGPFGPGLAAVGTGGAKPD